MSYRTVSVERDELIKTVESIRKTTNEIIAIVPSIIKEGWVIKYIIIYGN